MEELHYPGAGTTKKFLEEKQEREQQAEQAMAAASESARSVPFPPGMAKAAQPLPASSLTGTDPLALGSAPGNESAIPGMIP
jgi:hypothetical protein